jgi:hypothetical protein
VTRGVAFPILRWVGLAWLAVYLPAYAMTYGFANFLFLCNLAVLLAVVGLWRGSALLLSSQAIGLLLIGSAWTLDLVLRFATGRHWIGGTEYMWDSQWPLATRLLSLYHTALLVVLPYALRRVGYDRRGLWLQQGLAVLLVPAGRLVSPALNVNGAFVDPVFGRSFEPAALHVAIIAGALVLAIYPLSALLLGRMLPARPPA